MFASQLQNSTWNDLLIVIHCTIAINNLVDVKYLINNLSFYWTLMRISDLILRWCRIYQRINRPVNLDITWWSLYRVQVLYRKLIALELFGNNYTSVVLNAPKVNSMYSNQWFAEKLDCESKQHLNPQKKCPIYYRIFNRVSNLLTVLPVVCHLSDTFGSFTHKTTTLFFQICVMSCCDVPITMHNLLFQQHGNWHITGQNVNTNFKS